MAIWLAVPLVPFTESGTDPPGMNPQQTTPWLPAWIAQTAVDVKQPPKPMQKVELSAAMAIAVPLVPLTESGGCKYWLATRSPQQTTTPVPVWIAQLLRPLATTLLADPLVPFTESGGAAWPYPFSPQQTTALLPS